MSPLAAFKQKPKVDRDLVKTMWMHLDDDPNTEFVILVQNGGGICRIDNCHVVLNHTNDSVGRDAKQTIQMWVDLFPEKDG